MFDTTRTLVAEIIGTFLLTLVVVTVMTQGALGVPVPVMAALTLATLVFTIGNVSGCHINPAVTLGQLSIGKIPFLKAGGYLVSQFLGAQLAVMLVQSAGVQLPTFTMTGTSLEYLAEGLATAVFTFGIAAVITRKDVTDIAASFAVGTSLLLGIAVSMLGSNGFLNPAIAFAVGSGSLTYLLAPVIGAVVGFNLYKFLFVKKK